MQLLAGSSFRNTQFPADRGHNWFQIHWGNAQRHGNAGFGFDKPCFPIFLLHNHIFF